MIDVVNISVSIGAVGCIIAGAIAITHGQLRQSTRIFGVFCIAMGAVVIGNIACNLAGLDIPVPVFLATVTGLMVLEIAVLLFVKDKTPATQPQTTDKNA